MGNALRKNEEGTNVFVRSYKDARASDHDRDVRSCRSESTRDDPIYDMIWPAPEDEIASSDDKLDLLSACCLPRAPTLPVLLAEFELCSTTAQGAGEKAPQ